VIDLANVSGLKNIYFKDFSKNEYICKMNVYIHMYLHTYACEANGFYNPGINPI
jgi:hypothetical protein